MPMPLTQLLHIACRSWSDEWPATGSWYGAITFLDYMIDGVTPWDISKMTDTEFRMYLAKGHT